MTHAPKKQTPAREIARKAHCVAWLLAGVGVLVASTR